MEGRQYRGMSAWRLFPEGTVPYESTAAFHAALPRVPPLEIQARRPRLLHARGLVWNAAVMYAERTSDGGINPSVSDLGCGDGELLSLLKPDRYSAIKIRSWGYDVCPAHKQAWQERHVTAHIMDVFGAGWESVEFGDICIVTHVLNCLADPYAAIAWIGEHSKYLVASAPWASNPATHAKDDTWAWDFAGFGALAREGGFIPIHHQPLGGAQLMLAVRDNGQWL